MNQTDEMVASELYATLYGVVCGKVQELGFGDSFTNF
jgi:hypothetical protein